MTSSETIETSKPGKRRRRSREAGAPQQAAHPAFQPMPQPRLRLAPIELVSADELAGIHQSALTILKEIGMEVLNDEARQYFKDAGALVDDLRVRLDAGIIDQALTTVPSAFDLHSYNPAKTVRIGDGYMAFSSVASAPNCSDRAGGRRSGNRHDFQNLLRLAQSLGSIHINGGYPVEPIDIHPSIRHLVCLHDILTLTDMPFNCYSLGQQRNLDAIEMARLARGLPPEQLLQEPSLYTIINTNSPLKLDEPMGRGIIEMAKHNQITCVTPFTLSGAMAPVTIAGAVVQQNAEALLGMTLTQLVRPGAPFIYGGFTSNVDMRSGAPAFGTPETMKGALLGGQLARRYGVPYRSSNVNAANAVDAQAAYESVFALWGAVMGGVNLLKHGAGWMEGGLQASFEKMVIDADLLRMVGSFLTPLQTDQAAHALDAVREVGPGGHFFGAAHTQARYRDAFFDPLISDWRNYETWSEAGRPDAFSKASGIVETALNDYTPPVMPAEQAEALAAFVERRIAEGGVATDF